MVSTARQVKIKWVGGVDDIFKNLFSFRFSSSKDPQLPQKMSPTLSNQYSNKLKVYFQKVRLQKGFTVSCSSSFRAILRKSRHFDRYLLLRLGETELLN